MVVDQMLKNTIGVANTDDLIIEAVRDLVKDEIKNQIRPKEVLLVADAMTGQDAVNIADPGSVEGDAVGCRRGGRQVGGRARWHCCWSSSTP